MLIKSVFGDYALVRVLDSPYVQICNNEGEHSFAQRSTFLGEVVKLGQKVEENEFDVLARTPGHSQESNPLEGFVTAMQSIHEDVIPPIQEGDRVVCLTCSAVWLPPDPFSAGFDAKYAYAIIRAGGI